MQRIQLGLLALALTLLAARPARAGCCDDFWSCAAAVATGGISCAVSAAIDELNGVKRRAEESKAHAERERDRVLASMRGESERCASEAERDSSELARNVSGFEAQLSSARERAFRPVIAAQVKPSAALKGAALQAQLPAPTAQLAPATAAVSVTPPSAVNPGSVAQRASDTDVQRETERALAELAALKAQVAAEHDKLKREQLAAVRSVARSAMDGLRTAFEASLIAPLVGLIGSMPPPDPLLTAAIVAGVIAELDRIEREGNAALARKTAEAEASVKTEIDRLAIQLSEQRRREERGRQLATLSARALETRLQSDLDALRAALGTSSSSSGQKLVVNPQALKPLAIVRFAPVAPPAARPALAQLALSPAALPQFESKLKTELRDKLVEGNEPSSAKEAALIAEAKKRFAKDPGTRDKVIAYIQQASASMRGAK